MIAYRRLVLPLVALLAIAAMDTRAAAGNRRCLSDAEIEDEVGQAVRDGALLLDTSRLIGRPLCSGLPLPLRIQQMREAAFPAEQATRLAREERQRRDSVVAAAKAARIREIQDDWAAQEAAAQHEVEMAEARRDAAIADAEARDAAAGRMTPSASRVRRIIENNSELDSRLDLLVAADSEYWRVNRYATGSMHDSYLELVNRSQSTYVAFGSFRYDDGTSGWVRVRYADGVLQCLEFWDQAGVCRALGNSLSRQTMLSLGTELLKFALLSR